MKYLEIVNLDKYQNVSNTEKHWIKWYFKCLTDFRFCQLTDSERWLFVGLVLLSIQTTSNLPFNTLWLYQTLSFKTPKGSSMVDRGVKKMLKIGLISLSDSPIREEKKEKREEKSSSFKKSKRYYKPTGEEMRQSKGKWWVIPKVGGDWLEFVGSLEKDTELR